MITITPEAPYDWSWMLSFLRHRAVSGIEVITHDGLTRTLSIGNAKGLVTLRIEAERQVHINLSEGLVPVADKVIERIKRLLDLERSPQLMLDMLGELAATRPGLRLPGSVCPFEQIIRAVLGQLVSVAMAAKLTGKLVTAFGEPMFEGSNWRYFPTPEKLACASAQQIKALGMSQLRADTIINLARLTLCGELELTPPNDIARGIKSLMTLPGIGRWTASYFAIRGWQATDVFLPDDYLIKQRFRGMTPAQIRRYAERWSPWRTYALLHIWHREGWMPD